MWTCSSRRHWGWQVWNKQIWKGRWCWGIGQLWAKSLDLVIMNFQGDTIWEPTFYNNSWPVGSSELNMFIEWFIWQLFTNACSILDILSSSVKTPKINYTWILPLIFIIECQQYSRYCAMCWGYSGEQTRPYLCFNGVYGWVEETSNKS